MSVIVNLRNNTTFFMKVNGVDEIITPNSEIEDKTIQWVSTENKNIEIFDNETCTGQLICVSVLNFVNNDGIFVNRGDFNGAPLVKMQADVIGEAENIIHESSNQLDKLLEWSEIVADTTVNLSFWNI